MWAESLRDRRFGSLTRSGLLQLPAIQWSFASVTCGDPHANRGRSGTIMAFFRLRWCPIALVVLLLLGGYMGAYFTMSDLGNDELGRQVRLFNTAVELKVFSPIAWFETRIRGRWFYVTSDLAPADVSITETRPSTQD